MPDGRLTPGVSNTARYAERLQWPDLAGKTVLDIGAWDGYYSFEAERRGASRVVATDHYCWSGDGWGTREGFDLAHRLLGSRVEAIDIDVSEIRPETVGTFDIVLFLGVLYHLPEPLGSPRTRRVGHSRSADSRDDGRSHVHAAAGAVVSTGPVAAAVAISPLAERSEHVVRAKRSRRRRHARSTSVLEIKHISRVAVGRRLLHLVNAVVPFVNVQKNLRVVFHAWK